MWNYILFAIFSVTLPSKASIKNNSEVRHDGVYQALLIEDKPANIFEYLYFAENGTVQLYRTNVTELKKLKLIFEENNKNTVKATYQIKSRKIKFSLLEDEGTTHSQYKGPIKENQIELTTKIIKKNRIVGSSKILYRFIPFN